MDTQSDLYSLGAVLYEMLIGRPPFDGPTTMAVLRQVLDDDPVPPRRLNPRIHTDIETICLKCLEKEKDRRYRSGRELAEDIRRFNAGEPISATPLGLFASWVRRAGKHKSITLAATLGLCAGLIAVGYNLYASSRAQRRAEFDRQRTIETNLQRGQQSMEQAREAFERLATNSESAFDEKSVKLRKILLEAEEFFREVRRLDPGSAPAQNGLDSLKLGLYRLEVERLVFKARNFLRPPPNYEAARAFAEEALARDSGQKEADPLRKQAAQLRKEAIGIRSVSVFAEGPSAEVFARLFADAQGRLLPEPSERSAPGEQLGGTPITEQELTPGRYVLTFQRVSMEPQEATLLVSRDSDPVVGIDLSASERNMVRIPAGMVSIPQRERAHVPAFLIDRFEFPNQAGRPPQTGIGSLLEAQALCKKAGKSLCNSAQWLRACMGDGESKWPYGDDYKSGACATGFDPDAQKQAFPSGYFPQCRTKQGVYDMSGNVTEWTDGNPEDEIVFGGEWTDSVRTPEIFLSCRAGQIPRLINVERAGMRCCKAAK